VICTGTASPRAVANSTTARARRHQVRIRIRPIAVSATTAQNASRNPVSDRTVIPGSTRSRIWPTRKTAITDPPNPPTLTIPVAVEIRCSGL